MSTRSDGPTAPGPAETATQAGESLLEHAVRCWDAERENAERLSRRQHLLLSGVAAVFGLGLYRIEWHRAASAAVVISSPGVVVVIKAILSIAMVCLGWSFFQLIGSTSGSAPRDVDVTTKPHHRWPVQAADVLALPGWVLDQSLTEAQVQKVVFARTYSAYLDLRRRNARKRTAVDRGQKLFLIALGLVMVAILTYLWASDPSIRSDHETAKASARQRDAAQR